jgi:hypothetical protein
MMWTLLNAADAGWAKAGRGVAVLRRFCFPPLPTRPISAIAEARSDGVGKGAQAQCTCQRLRHAPLPTRHMEKDG